MSLEKNSTVRTYNINTPQYKLYCEMYKNQTLEFAKRKREEYSKLDKKKMSIKKALLLLNDFLSDKELLYQTHNRVTG